MLVCFPPREHGFQLWQSRSGFRKCFCVYNLKRRGSAPFENFLDLRMGLGRLAADPVGSALVSSPRTATAQHSLLPQNGQAWLITSESSRLLTFLHVSDQCNTGVNLPVPGRSRSWYQHREGSFLLRRCLETGLLFCEIFWTRLFRPPWRGWQAAKWYVSLPMSSWCLSNSEDSLRQSADTTVH